MRGTPDPQLAMLTTLSPEDLIPRDHPIRRIRVVVDAVLASMDDLFEGLYSEQGRPSVPPEALLKASVLMAMYSIRSERAFCERLNYDLLFKWFLDMRTVADSYDALAETTNGLYKTECIYGPDAPRRWADVGEVELATLTWIHWFNEHRLHSHCGDIPPAEFETAFYAAQRPSPAGVGNQ